MILHGLPGLNDGSLHSRGLTTHLPKVMRLEEVVRCEWHPAVVLRVEHPERLVDVVRHHPDELALVADEHPQAQAFVVWEGGEASTARRPDTRHSVVSGCRQVQPVRGVKDHENHAKCEESLLSIDDVQVVAALVEDDRAKDVWKLRTGRVSLRVPNIIDQLQRRDRFPAIGTLVVRDPEVVLERVK